jgi:fibronectin type 3 domain-containing protein
VELSWNPSNTPQVGYFVYRGAAAGGPYAKQTLSPVSTTKFTDANVAGGASYSYVVTAVNAENIESTYSNEVVVAIP